MGRKKKEAAPLAPGDVVDVGGETLRITGVGPEHFDAEPVTDPTTPAGLNTHAHVGMSCRYTNKGGYVRAAIVEGVDADGYRLAVFDPIERCVRHEHGVPADAIAPVG